MKPFEVDGIRYGIRYGEPEGPGVWCIRPMFELFFDDDPHAEDEDRCQMYPSDPPTEEELDLYVKERILPAT